MLNLTNYITPPTVVTVNKLVRDTKSGSYRIPHFQRNFLWEEQDTIDLFDSICKGYPIGSLMVWRTNERFPSYGYIGHQSFTIPNSSNPSHNNNYIIDGYQRLSSLFLYLGAGLYRQEEEIFLDQVGAGVRWPLYINLKDQIFTFDSKKEPYIMPAHYIMNEMHMLDFMSMLKKSDNSELVEVASNFTRVIKDYPIIVSHLDVDDINMAIESFSRINKGGSKIGPIDFISALVYDNKYEDPQDSPLVQIKKTLSNSGWDLTEKQLVMLIAGALDDQGMSLGQNALDTIIKKIKDKTVQHQEALFKLNHSIKDAILFFELKCYVKGTNMLPYAYTFVVVTLALLKLKDKTLSVESQDELASWVIKTTYDGIFSGISESTLKREFSKVLIAIEDGAEIPFELKSIDAPIKFNYNSARSRMLAIIMAKVADRVLNTDTEHINQLAQNGAGAVYAIFKDTSPEARFVVRDGDKKVLDRLIHDLRTANKINDCDMKYSDAYLIPNEMLIEPTDENILACRRLLILQAETEFLAHFNIETSEDYKNEIDSLSKKTCPHWETIEDTLNTSSPPDSQHDADPGGLSKIMTNSTKPKQLENNMPEYVITLGLMHPQEKNIFIQYLNDNNIPHQWKINRRYQENGITKNNIMFREGLVIVLSRKEAQDIIDDFLQNPQASYLQNYFGIISLDRDTYLDEELRNKQAVVTIEPQSST